MGAKLTNSEIIANLSQAIATLVAVLLAFLLSILSDRSSWKHRKKEQIREHQIDSMKSLVQIMQKISYYIMEIVQIRQKVLNEIHDDCRVDSTLKNKITSGNSQIKKELDELENIRILFLNELWELKFLRYGEKQIKIIEEYLDIYDAIIKEFRDSQNYIENENISNDNYNSIALAFEKFIRVGEDGLTK